MNELVCRRTVKQRAVSYDPSLHADTEHLPCEGCGRWVNSYEMHHRQFRSRGGVWVPSNILLLCGWCHNCATDERPWAVARGFNVKTGQEPSRVPVRLWYADEALCLIGDDGGYLLVA